MKKMVLVAWLSVVFAGIVALFWYNEWKYQLPTPVPAGYVEVKKGEQVVLPVQLVADRQKPVFLHFFNPDCPCSKFNMKHFKSLVREYQNRVNFAVVVLNNDRYSPEQIRDKFGVDLPVSFDTALATTCGVYSTPQAAIIKPDHQLFYRGNYNKSRYCTDKKTNYAQIALDALLQNNQNVHFDRYALTAYGCELPQCTKNKSNVD